MDIDTIFHRNLGETCLSFAAISDDSSSGKKSCVFGKQIGLEIFP